MLWYLEHLVLVELPEAQCYTFAIPTPDSASPALGTLRVNPSMSM
jgi:hypothetical protein